MPSFRYVWVPCSMAEPMETRALEYEAGAAVGCLPDHLRALWATDQPGEGGRGSGEEEVLGALMAKLREQGVADEAHARQLAAGLAKQTFVETILLGTSAAAPPTTVAVYVDDSGKLRGKTENLRASLLTGMCGAPHQVFGDACVARYLDSERQPQQQQHQHGEGTAPGPAVSADAGAGAGGEGDRFERVDFVLAEVEAGSAWLGAAAAAAGRAVGPNGVPGLQRTASQLHSARLRQSANELFGKADFEGALELYRQGAAQSETEEARASLLSATAMCLLKLERWALCEEAASEVLALGPSAPTGPHKQLHIKTLFRRAMARRHLGNTTGVAQDVAEARRLEPRIAIPPGLE